MRKFNDGTKDYKFAASIYDSVLEPGLRAVRDKTREVSGVADSDKVIDVCCGTGRQAEMYADIGASVVGLDISDYMIAKAKPKERDNLIFIQGNAAEIPYEDSYFDCASSGYAFHEISEELRTGFLREMQRVVKDGGTLVFVDFSVPLNGGYKVVYYKSLFRTIEWVAGGDHYRNYREWMENGGLLGFVNRNKMKDEDMSFLAKGNLAIVKIANNK